MTYVGIGQKELKTNWPFTTGLTAGTTSQTGRVENLLPLEGSNVRREQRKGIQ